MHYFKRGLLVALFSFILLESVSATTCGYEEKAKLNNEISNVKSNYEIKERVLDESEYVVPDAIAGTDEEEDYVATEEYIGVNILNITENMYVEVSNDYNEEVKTYYYQDSSNGNISFDWYNINTVATFTIKVYASSTTGCEGEILKTMSLKLPRYNDYSNYSVCEGLTDYYLCQRYVTFSEVDFDTFITRIDKQYDRNGSSEGEKKQDKWYFKVKDFIVDHKVAFIAGGVVLIVGVGGATFVIIKRRRRSII